MPKTQLRKTNNTQTKRRHMPSWFYQISLGVPTDKNNRLECPCTEEGMDEHRKCFLQHTNKATTLDRPKVLYVSTGCNQHPLSTTHYKSSRGQAVNSKFPPPWGHNPQYLTTRNSHQAFQIYSFQKSGPILIWTSSRPHPNCPRRGQDNPSNSGHTDNSDTFSITHNYIPSMLDRQLTPFEVICTKKRTAKAFELWHIFYPILWPQPQIQYRNQ